MDAPYYAVIVTEAAHSTSTETGHADDLVVAVFLTDDQADAVEHQVRLVGGRYPYPGYRVTVAPVRLTKPNVPA